MRIPHFILLFCLAVFSGYAIPKNDRVVFFDDFRGLPRGVFNSEGGAHTEYHFLHEAMPKGNWALSTFSSGSKQNSWQVRDENGDRVIYQVHNFKPGSYTHPMLVAGDELWANYTFETHFSPAKGASESGVVFRYVNDRCYYFFGIIGEEVVLKLVNNETGFHKPNEKILDKKPFIFQEHTWLTARVEVNGSRITAKIEGGPILAARDSTFMKGKIGLIADLPTRYTSVEVKMTENEQLGWEKNRADFDRMEHELQQKNPKPVVWKKVVTPDFGTGRNLRFGDLNNDGTIDLLIGQVVNHGLKDRNSELSCLTAMTFDGKILWQKGVADPWKTKLTSDVAFQIHDIDLDGKNEVIYTMNQMIYVAEGATGKVKYSSPTPLTPGEISTTGGNNSFERILGDCLYFCDLRGKGYDSDIILKDRYNHFWALDDKLNVIWKGSCKTGHYPYAYDTDNDGKDELLIGYSLFDDDGRLLWSLDKVVEDHADGVAIVDMQQIGKPGILCAASDEGIFFADLNGKILKHHYIGHVQNPTVANFRDDLPGLEAVSVNFWGNQGIIHYYNSQGDIYNSFEPNQFGSLCLPVNWTGGSEEFFQHNSNVDLGGMFDGWSRKVVVFPDDGHPDMCNAVLDITGDCRDEIVVWDQNEIWVYTQDDNPKQGKLYHPQRNKLYNESNYKAVVSLPGWSDSTGRNINTASEKQKVNIPMRKLTNILLFLLFSGSTFAQKTIRLEDLDISKIRQRSGNPKRILPESGDSLRLGGVKFSHGIGTVAESIFEVDLKGNVSRFHGFVGIGDKAGDKGDVEFQIFADGKMIWSSGLMKGSARNQLVDIDLTGIQRIVFYVAEEHNWDQLPVYWADPELTVSGDAGEIKAFVEKEEILTPKAGPQPRINGARVFGVRPQSPFLFTIPATGDRPIEFSATNLPKELSLNSKTGQISGKLSTKGTYNITLIAKNNSGKDKENLRVVCGDKLALTPQMGWNSYNLWGCSHVNDQKIRGIADAFISKGLINFGWTYVNIDCGWADEVVDPVTLELKPNSKFPDMTALCAYIHSLGLKAGIYSTPWTHGYDGRKGSSADTPKREYLEKNRDGEPSKAVGKYHFEEIDAKQYAGWGFDYLKYDWTPNDIPATERMANALKAQSRDLIYSLSNEATLALGDEYTRLANSWRTTDDINDTWGSMSTIGFNQDKWNKYAAPGHWNDADMLVVGKVGWHGETRPSKLTPNEQYTHISLWSLLASPLLLGCDLVHIDDFTFSLITNAEVIEVNQDPLGKQAVLMERDAEKECWMKEMEDGSKVVGLFNRSFFETKITIGWKTLGISNNWRIRDLWRQKDLGKSNEKFTTLVQGHGVMLVRLFPR